MPYAILQCGLLDAARYRTREEAAAEAERLNAEMSDECGEDLGDGAATVVAVDADGEIDEG